MKSYKIFFSTIICLLCLDSCGKKSNLVFPDEKKAVDFKKNIEGYNIADTNEEKDKKFQYYSERKKYNEERKLRFFKKVKEKQQTEENSKDTNKK